MTKEKEGKQEEVGSFCPYNKLECDECSFMWNEMGYCVLEIQYGGKHGEE